MAATETTVTFTAAEIEEIADEVQGMTYVIEAVNGHQDTPLTDNLHKLGVRAVQPHPRQLLGRGRQRTNRGVGGTRSAGIRDQPRVGEVMAESDLYEELTG